MRLSTTLIHEQNSLDVRKCNKGSLLLDTHVFPSLLDLQLLQALTKVFVNAIVSSTKKMPYGMQCIAREMLLELRVCIAYKFVSHFPLIIHSIFSNDSLTPLKNHMHHVLVGQSMIGSSIQLSCAYLRR